MTDLKQVPATYERKQYIGGADIAGVLGISPWSTPVSVWQRKTEEREQRPSSGKKKLFQRGKVWEQVVAEMLVAQLEAEEFKVKVTGMNHRYVDPIIPYFASEIDYELEIEGLPGPINCELKTVHPNAAREWGDPDSDELIVPVQYLAQCQWGLGITGRQVCILAPLFGADDLKVYVVRRDEDTILGMRDRAQAFWIKHVLTGIAPEPENLADVNRLFKFQSDKNLIADDRIMRTLMNYRAVAADLEARERELDALEFDLKVAMADASSIIAPGFKSPLVTWKNQTTQRLDQQALKQDYPKLVRQYQREGMQRVFRVGNFNHQEYEHHGRERRKIE